MLVLWSVPAVQGGLHRWTTPSTASPALSPGRKLLAGFDGKTLRVLDAETGALKGEGTAPTGLGTRPEWKAAAFRPDGQEVVALFGNGSLVGWDLKTGKVARVQADRRPPAAGAAGMVGREPRPARQPVARRPRLAAGSSGSTSAPRSAPAGPDGRHWYVGRGIRRAGVGHARGDRLARPEPGEGRGPAGRPQGPRP